MQVRTNVGCVELGRYFLSHEGLLPALLLCALLAGRLSGSFLRLSCTGLVTLALVRLVVSEGVEDCGGLGWDFWGEGDVVSVDVAGELA